MLYKYPYTDFHELNLDYILKLVRENAGLHIEVSGNQLLLKTLDGSIISAVTAPYADNAGHADTADTANNARTATTASHAITADTATTASNSITADHATTADSATTAGHATTAGTATNATNANYATTAGTAVNADHATTADTATNAVNTDSADHATNAIETVTINGDSIVFTTYGGTSFTLTIPYAVKAFKDDLGNVIKNTYVANVVDDSGVLKFKDSQGNTIVSLTPTFTNAVGDSYNNLIADYIKAIVANSNSNYVTVEHGTGNVDTITINYSNTAWKDTNGNVIKNSYVKEMECIEVSGHYYLVAYNGDTPKAEIFRIALESDTAGHADTADYATNAGHADTADTATTATTATNAGHATTADSANTAGTATTATSATNASHAITADSATTATNANHATTADSTISCYIIEADHIGQTNDFTVRGIKDNLGNTVSFSNMDKYNLPIYFLLYSAENPNAVMYKVTVTNINPNGNLFDFIGNYIEPISNTSYITNMYKVTYDTNTSSFNTMTLLAVSTLVPTP